MKNSKNKSLENNTSSNLASLQQRANNDFFSFNFGNKEKWFIGISLLLYFSFILLKWNGSSISVWNQIFGTIQNTKKSVIFGEAVPIRQDEWMVYTPMLLNQYENGMNVINESLGEGNITLPINVPVKHFSIFFKPNMIFFLFLNKEQGYSAFWNFKIFGIIISVFLFLSCLTKNNFLLSVFGAFWVYLSPVTQWWFSTNIPEMTTSFCLTFFFLIQFINSTKKLHSILYSFGLVYSMFFFAMQLYPPYMFPFAHFGVFLLIAIIFEKRELIKLVFLDKIKMISFIFLTIISGLLFALFLQEMKSIVDTMLQTEYPGKRDFTGVTIISYLDAFTAYFDFFHTKTKFPMYPGSGSQSEIAEALWIFPFAFFGVVYNAIRYKTHDYVLYVFLIYFIFIVLWVFVGLPPFLYKILLLDMTTPDRGSQIIGICGIFITIIYISRTSKNANMNTFASIIFSILIFVFVAFIGYKSNEVLNNFFTSTQILVAAFLISLSGFCMFNFNNMFLRFGFVGIILFISFKNIAINPIQVGLSPITKNPLYDNVKSIYRLNPDKGWIVMGSSMVANFIRCTGAKVINGVNYIPNYKYTSVLDPENKNKKVYNRYAHITCYPFINNTDTIAFTLNNADAYSMGIDPSSEKLKKIGVKYVVFTYDPQPIEVRNLEQISKDGISIYQFKD
ncbi:MAG: hypothetical protein SFY32_03830 [Bacteroidota bacterium]|nr:hypothetical protein [Bacteroidota bacterium]